MGDEPGVVEIESIDVVVRVSSLQFESSEVTVVIVPLRGIVLGRNGFEFGVWEYEGGCETFSNCPLSSASSCKTERAREDILAREASMSRLLSL